MQGGLSSVGGDQGSDTELVSVVIPVYNAERFIVATIKSVQSQSYQNWELLCVDDASSDSSASLIRGIMKSDARVRLITQKENQGVAEARNRGVRAAKGRYIAYLDADDLWRPDKLRTQVLFMKENRSVFCFTAYEFAYPNGVATGVSVGAPLSVSSQDFLKNNIIWTSTVMIDADSVDVDFMMMPDRMYGEDALTWHRILKRYGDAAGVNQPLALYRRTRGTLSSNKLRIILKKWHLYGDFEGITLHERLYYFYHSLYSAARKRLRSVELAHSQSVDDSNLNILHVANLRDQPYSGVANVVPKYLEHQSKNANVALLNIDDYIPPNAKGRYSISKYEKTSLGFRGTPSLPHPDIVVFHEIYWPQFIGIARYYRKLGVPYIVIPHVSLTRTAQRRKRLKKLVGNFIMFDRFVKNSSAIQFLSQSEKDQTAKFPRKPCYIRSNGIEIVGRRKKKFNKDKLRMVYVGRLDYTIKGIDRMLDALNIIQEQARSLDIKLSLYGPSEDGDLRKILETIERHGISDIVDVSGGLFGVNKVETILQSDCFIQLSRTEGQPLGIIEAMDLGMPCIVTKGTTFYDVVGVNGAGIPVSDRMEDIARVILDVRNGEYDLQSLSKESSKYVGRKHEWGVLSEDMLSDYRSVIAQGDVNQKAIN